ncbi:MAG: hypothetical protein VR67_00325 [Peptococcaceae bacterium BRH_c8a]|nr:MAG: hypothetical protein VR67_00325 [Peptococcaceae bacterium BRH_c8a]
MQISAIVPILLNILLSEQQNQKQAPREQVAFRDVMQAQLTRPSAANTETTTAAPQHRAGESSEPVLMPLPLRSPLFPDTQFYAFRRRDEEKQGQKGEDGETGIVFSLGTASLGRLFFMLVRKAEAISITCHTENGAIAGRLNTRAEELKKQIQAIGFEQVTFRCTVLDPNLVKPTAGFSSPGLLDLKV